MPICSSLARGRARRRQRNARVAYALYPDSSEERVAARFNYRQIAGVRGLLLARQAEFDPAQSLRMLTQADARMSAVFGAAAGSTAPATAQATPPTPSDTLQPPLAPLDDASAELPSNTALLSAEHPQSVDSPLPWLARRLHQAEVDGQALVQASRGFTQG